MRRYRSFTFDDHTRYLQQVEALLRTRASQGSHTTVALFDPEEYAAFCADTGLDPDIPSSRTRFTAELAATGPTIPYDGRPLADLVPALIDEAVRQATWEYASTLLARLGACASCGEDIGRAAFTWASGLLVRVENGDECFGRCRDAAHEVSVASSGGVEDANEQARRSCERGSADVLAAGGAGSQSGEERRGVFPGGLAYGLVDKGGDEVGQGLTLVGKDGAGARQFGGEGGQIGRLVRSLDPARLDAGEVQQRVDELFQPQPVAVDDIQSLSLRRG